MSANPMFIRPDHTVAEVPVPVGDETTRMVGNTVVYYTIVDDVEQFVSLGSPGAFHDPVVLTSRTIQNFEEFTDDRHPYWLTSPTGILAISWNSPEETTEVWVIKLTEAGAFSSEAFFVVDKKIGLADHPNNVGPELQAVGALQHTLTTDEFENPLTAEEEWWIWVATQTGVSVKVHLTTDPFATQDFTEGTVPGMPGRGVYDGIVTTTYAEETDTGTTEVVTVGVLIDATATGGDGAHIVSDNLTKDSPYEEQEGAGSGVPDEFWSAASIHWSTATAIGELYLQVNDLGTWTTVASFAVSGTEGSVNIIDGLGFDPSYINDRFGTEFTYTIADGVRVITDFDGPTTEGSYSVIGDYTYDKPHGDHVDPVAPYTYHREDGTDVTDYDAPTRLAFVSDTPFGFVVYDHMRHSYEDEHDTYAIAAYLRAGGELTAEFTFDVRPNGWQVDFDGSPSVGDDIVLYTWEWDDPLVDDQPTDLQQQSHFYKVDQVYNVTLTITDASGSTASVTHPVTVPGGAIIGDLLGTEQHFTGL